MKKIFATMLSILFVLSCLLPSGVIFAEETSEIVQKYDEKARDILVAISVLSKEQVFDGTEVQIVTRGELADILTKLSLYPEGGKAESAAYKDVKEGHKYYAGILGAATLGLMKGYEDNTFRPDNGITFGELSKVIIRLLGYEQVIQNEDYDAYATASTLKLFVGLQGKRDKNTAVNKTNMVTVLFNAVHTKMMTVSSYGSDPTYEIDENACILTEYFDVHWNKGTITKNDVTALSSTSASCAPVGCVEINGNDYMVGNTNATDLLGYRVEYYYRTNANELSDRELLYASEKGLNEVLTINSTSLLEPGSDINVIRYEDESGRVKTQSIPATSFFLYNGVPASLSAENVTMDLGKITFINNGTGSKWSVVKVESYETVVVESADVSKGVVYSKYPDKTPLNAISDGLSNFTYDPDEVNKTVFFCDSYGYAYDPLGLSEWDVLLIKRDRSNLRTNIQRLVIERTGAVTAKSGKDVIFVDDCEYEVAPWIINQNPSVMPELGKSYIFYLDSAERIVAVREFNENEFSFAYFIDGAVNNRSKTYEIMICEDIGTVSVKECAQTVIVDGLRKKNPKDQEAAIETVATDVTTRLVQIRYNQDGFVKEIKTVAGGEFIHKDYSGVYYTSASTLGGKVAVDSSLIQFYVPTDGDEERYYTKKGSSQLASDISYRATNGKYAYVLTEEPRVVSIVHLVDVKSSSSSYFDALNQTNPTYMIDDIRYSWDEVSEDYVTEISVWDKGTNTTIKVRDDYVLKFASPAMDYYSSSNLEEQIFTSYDESNPLNFQLGKGDIIKIRKDQGGYIVRIEIIYDYDNDRMFVQSPSTPYKNNTNGWDSHYRMLMGYIYKRNEGFFQFACTENDSSDVPVAVEGSQVEVMKDNSNIVTVYDSCEDAIYKGTMNDIFSYDIANINASRVLIEVRNGTPQRIFVYR